MTDTLSLEQVDHDPFNEATVTSQPDSPLRATWNKYAGRFNDWLSASGQDPGPDHVPGTFVGWPQAINRAVGINGPRQGVVSDVANHIDRNMISGPLAEAEKFGQDPQASAAASPIAQAFKEIGQGGTGDPERDARNQELATGFGSQAAGWMALPGFGRAATMAEPVKEILRGQLEKNVPQVPDNLRSSFGEWFGKDRTYWHVTPTRNVESIKQQGLRQGAGPRALSNDDPAAVYLFKSEADARDAHEAWMRDEYKEPLSLLKITLPRHVNPRWVPQEREYQLSQDILPQYISHAGKLGVEDASNLHLQPVEHNPFETATVH